MPDPVLHLLAGPNGSGKSTLAAEVLRPVTGLEFVNADVIAAARWPSDPSGHAYEAAAAAAARRAELITDRVSFITETVFSHPSKLELVDGAVEAGYLVSLHVVIVPLALATARVANRVTNGGHAVPPNKIRERYGRLWPLVTAAVARVDESLFYDNSRTSAPFRVVARYDRGRSVATPEWPPWTPEVLSRMT